MGYSVASGPGWESGRPRTASDVLGNIQTTFSALSRRQRAEEAAGGVLANRLEDLDDALSELMALFTPGPWFYQDLRLALSHEGGQRLGYVLDSGGGGSGARANLRFNAAELNNLTLALFLLCSLSAAKPFKVIVLDDPFQNMDDLTVSTVAKGLAKLRRACPVDHQVLIFLHAEGAVDHVRHHVPSTVYRLPWVSPPNCTSERRICASGRRCRSRTSVLSRDADVSTANRTSGAHACKSDRQQLMRVCVWPTNLMIGVPSGAETCGLSQIEVSYGWKKWGLVI